MKYTVLGVLLAVLACTTPTPTDRPTGLAMTELNTGTPTSLSVFAKWNASSVATPTGPITYDIMWVRNGASLRTVNGTAALADTVPAFPRAALTMADTIDLSVRSSYQGRKSAWATARRIFPNNDTQIPTVPTITQVDTL